MMSEINPHKNDFSESLEKAEEKLKQIEKSSGNRIIGHEHELSVYGIELRMQNDELYASQQKLTAVLRQYAELFEFSPVGYFILDKNGVIEKVNERGGVQLAIDRMHLYGRPFSAFLNDESHKENFHRHLNLIIDAEKPHHLECEIIRYDGSVFSALIKCTLIKDEQQQINHLLLIVADISEIKEHERQVAHALKKEMELNEMKSRFIAMASHEFRTPLSAILSSTCLIDEYSRLGQEDKMQKHIMRIKSSVQDLETILDDFLSLEKLESGKVEIVRRTFNLPEFCDDVLEDVRALTKNGQHIKYKHTGDKEIKEDKKILQHILLNMLSNACKYSGEDKEINLYTEVSNQKVLMKVKDSGIGIPQDEQKNIFTRFFRANNAVAIKGAGLGLNIVKRYVELLNGNISFTSRTNKGTTFIAEFPKNNSK